MSKSIKAALAEVNAIGNEHSLPREELLAKLSAGEKVRANGARAVAERFGVPFDEMDAAIKAERDIARAPAPLRRIAHAFMVSGFLAGVAWQQGRDNDV